MPSVQDVKQLKQSAADIGYEAAGISATAGSVGDIIMEQVRADRAQRGVSKLATDRGNVMGQLASDPQRIREFGTSEGFTMDPINVDYWTSQQRARNLSTLGTVAQQSKENEGTLQEVIQAGANQLYGLASMKEAEAKRDKAKADAMMEELLYKADRADREFDEWLQREKLGDSRAEEPSILEQWIKHQQMIAGAQQTDAQQTNIPLDENGNPAASPNVIEDEEFSVLGAVREWFNKFTGKLNPGQAGMLGNIESALPK